MKKLFILIVFLCLYSTGICATWYSQGTSDITTLSNWNSTSSGTGTSPTTFANTGDIWIVQTDMIIRNGSWSIGGSLQFAGGSLSKSAGGATIITIGGNLTMATATYINSTNNAGGITINITGNVSLSSNAGITYSSTHTPTVTINITGDLSLSGSSYIGTTTGNASFYTNLSGNLSLSGTAYFVNTSALNYVYFANTSSTITVPQTITYTSTSTAGSNTNYTVNSGCVVRLLNNFANNHSGSFAVNGTLDCQTYSLTDDGTSSFTINSGGTLYTANSLGINGSITTNTHTFNSGSNYIFNGSVSQYTGSLMPTNIVSPAFVTINNSMGVTPTNTTTFSSGSTLNLQNGLFTNTTSNLIMNSGSNVKCDNGTLAVTPTTYSGINLTYTNLGNNQLILTTGNEFPASFSGNVNINHTGATITLNNSKTLSVLASFGNIILTSGSLDASVSNYNISLSGNWTNNASTMAFVPRTGTVIFNGTSAQTLGGSASTTFNTVTINNAAGVTLSQTTTFSSGSTLNLQNGAFNNTSSNLIMSSGSNLVRDAGTIAATPTTYSGVNLNYAVLGSGSSVTTGNEFPASLTGNVTINESGKTITLQNTKVLTGNIIISAGTLAAGSNNISITGNWTNNATFTSGTGTVTFNGSTGQTIGGASNTGFYGITINKTGGDATLLNTVSVSNLLTLTSGNIILGSNNFVLGASATISGTPSSSRMLIANGGGQVQKQYNVGTASGSFTFPIGDNTAKYTPVIITFTGGTCNTGAYLGVSVTPAKEPHNLSSTDYLNRYWSISNSNITSPVFNVSATYLPADVIGTESNIYTGQYTGTSWSFYSAANTSTHTLSATGVSAPSANFTGCKNIEIEISPVSSSICNGGNTTISVISSLGTSPFTYSWTCSSGAGALSSTTGTTITASPTVTSTVTVTITDFLGLTTSASSIITVSPTPLSSGITNNSPVCNGNSSFLFANSSYATAWMWIGPGSFSSTLQNPTFIPSVSGVYSLTVSNSGGSGCNPTTVYTSTVIVNTQPSDISANASPNPVCEGNNLTITGTVTGGSGLTYGWAGPNGYYSSDLNPASFAVSTLSAGVYTLTVTPAGCNATTTTTSTVVVNTQPSAISANASPNPVCDGGSLTLAGTVTGGSGLTYGWAGPNGYYSSDLNPASFAVSTLSAGVYTLTVTPAGCNATTTTTSTVVVNTQPSAISANASPNPICEGNNLTITGTVTGGSGLSFGWTGPNGYYSSDLNPGSFTVSTLSAGVYTLTVTPAGCSPIYVSTSNITVDDSIHSITVVAYPNPLCAGVTLHLNGILCGGSDIEYLWIGPNGYIATDLNPSGITFSALNAGVYTLIATPGVCPAVSANTLPVVLSSHQAWLISASTSDWNTYSNWTCGTVPIATDTVLIPFGAINAPELHSASIGSLFNLTIDSGAVINLDDMAVLNVKGTFINSGNVNGAGYLSFNGSTSQVLYGKGNVTNIEILNSNGVSVNTTTDTLTVKGTLQLSDGNLNTNDKLVLSMSDDQVAKPVNGRIGTITGGTITGKVIVQQYIMGGRRAYRFWGTPFSDSITLSQVQNNIDVTGLSGALHGFTTTASNAPSAFWYHTLASNSSIVTGGGDPGWKPFTWCTATPGLAPSADTNLIHRFEGLRLFFRGVKGQGLDGLPYPPSPVTVKQWGHVNTGDFYMPLQKWFAKNGSTWIQDYNLKSNPYPSAIDLGAIIHNAWTDSLLAESKFYVWYPYGGAAGVFVTVDESTYSPYIIPANTAFEVRARFGHDSSKLHFTESTKVSSTTNQDLLKTKTNEIALNIYDASYHIWDMFKLKFNENASDAYDMSFDGGKPINTDLNFYSWSTDHQPLSWDERPYKSSKIISLGLSTNLHQDFIIKVDNFYVPENGNLYLHDKYTEQYVLLQQGTEYRFTVTGNDATQGDNRFELGIDNGESQMQSSNKNLNIVMMPNPAINNVIITYNTPLIEQASIKIFTVEGIIVFAQEYGNQQHGSINIPVTNLASGVYMVEFTSGNDKIVKRLIKE